MSTKRQALNLAAALSALALAACQVGGPIRGPISSAPTGVEGDWIGTDGVAISRFGGGRFETIATDTGNKLAEGSYRFIDRQTVQIEVRSLIRQTMTTVNCAMVAPSQLNCTSSTGQQFVLTRRTGIS